MDVQEEVPSFKELCIRYETLKSKNTFNKQNISGSSNSHNAIDLESDLWLKAIELRLQKLLLNLSQKYNEKL